MPSGILKNSDCFISDVTIKLMEGNMKISYKKTGPFKIEKIITDDPQYLIVEFEDINPETGKPYNLDGSDSKMIVNVNLFIERILRVQNFPIYLIDERLSSKHYKTSTKISKKGVHEKSACLILDDFLALYHNYKND